LDTGNRDGSGLGKCLAVRAKEERFGEKYVDEFL